MSKTPSASVIDLRQFADPVLNQGSIGSCFENAVASELYMMMKLAGHPIVPLSRLQMYADVRTYQGTFNTDSGSFPELALNALKKTGIANESSWAYNTDNIFIHPTQSVVTEAAQHKILSWNANNVDAAAYTIRDDIAKYLSQGKPVVLAFTPHSYFYSERGPLENQLNYGTDKLKDGHAVVIVGVDDNLNGGSYIVKNSWGTTWGDGGYGTIKYSQFGLSYDFQGAYTINGFNGVDLTYTEARKTVATEYACILGRAAEISGLDWWAHTGLNKEQMAQALIYSTEGRAIYGNKTDAQFVETVYTNVLNRHSDSSGMMFYTTLLHNGMTRGDIMSMVINAVSRDNGPEQAAHDFLVNKINVSEYISIATQYIGGKDALTHDIINRVDSDVNHTEILKIGIPHELGII